jgi:hypothetical protein
MNNQHLVIIKNPSGNNKIKIPYLSAIRIFFRENKSQIKKISIIKNTKKNTL